MRYLLTLGLALGIALLKKGVSYWFISSGSGSVPFQP